MPRPLVSLAGLPKPLRGVLHEFVAFLSALGKSAGKAFHEPLECKLLQPSRPLETEILVHRPELLLGRHHELRHDGN
jgi:hypothetical protein